MLVLEVFPNQPVELLDMTSGIKSTVQVIYRKNNNHVALAIDAPQEIRITKIDQNEKRN